MSRLFHSVSLLSLTVLGLASCTGPKPALSKGAPSSAVSAPTSTVGAPTSAAGAPPSTVVNPPPDPNADRDAYWNLAMQRYKVTATGIQPEAATLPQPGSSNANNPVTTAPTVSTTPSVSTPATGVVPTKSLNPADIPYAIPVPGKRGIVTSPFDPNGRPIDVRDFNPGQLSQCPYSGKIFRVPPLK